MQINIKKLKKIFKCDVIDEGNQIIFVYNDIEINMEKDCIDISLTDNKGNDISIYDRDGSLRISGYTRRLSRSEKKIIKILKNNINIIYY